MKTLHSRHGGEPRRSAAQAGDEAIHPPGLDCFVGMRPSHNDGKHYGRLLRLAFCLLTSGLCLLTFAGPAHADCTSPAGVAGDQFYNTTYNVMQFCNGTDWVNMGASGGGASETDPQVGTLTNTKWCTTDGTDIDCTSNAPLTSESDPQVGALTNTKWCTTNGTLISCTSDAPLAAETDPQVGAITENKWCRASGSQVVCDQDAPSAGTGGFDLLNSGTVADQATLDIALPAGYHSYRIVLQNLVPATDDVALWLRTSSNGGTSYDSGASDYKWAAYYAGVDSGGSGFDGVISDSSDSEIEIAGEFGNSTNENGSVEIHVTNPAVSKAKLIEASILKYDNGQAFTYDSLAGARMSSTAIDAVRLLMSSGNIASADWALYGYSAGSNCAGDAVGGYCWYLGTNGQSCDTVCASHGGCNLTGTRDYAGFGGTNANCVSVLNALSVPGSTVTDHGGETAGAGCYVSVSSVRSRDMGFTTVCYSSAGSRACACNE